MLHLVDCCYLSPAVVVAFDPDSQHLLNCQLTTTSGAVAAPIGAALGVAALFYASGIPRVQKDILQVSILEEQTAYERPTNRTALTSIQKFPVIGPYFVKTVHPADSVSAICLRYFFFRLEDCEHQLTTQTGLLNNMH